MGAVQTAASECLRYRGKSKQLEHVYYLGGYIINGQHNDDDFQDGGSGQKALAIEEVPWASLKALYR